MNNATKEDWEHLPMSEEALEALTTFFISILESDDVADIEEARQTFKKVRKQDMQRWLQEREDNGRN